MSSLAVFRYLPRTIRLTREGGYFVLLAIGVGFAAVNTGANLLYLLAAMMLSVIVVSGLLSEQSLRKVAVAVGEPPPFFAGERALIPVRVHNRKRRLSSFSLRVAPAWTGPPPSREAYFIQIPPKGERTDFLQVVFPRRGKIRMEGIKLSTLFPFGLFLKTAAKEAPMEIWVYPNIRPISWGAFSASGGREPNVRWTEASLVSERVGQGAGFNQFRNYHLGDDSRLIHWKLSARQGRLIVREPEREEEREIVLFFDNRAPKIRSADWEGLFERGIETTASLAAAMIGEGLRVGLQTADQTIPADAAPGQLDRLLKALAVLAPVAESEAPDPARRPMIWIQLEGDRSWNEKGPLWEGVITVHRPERGDVVR